MGLRPDAVPGIVASRGDGAALHDDAAVAAWLRERRGAAGLAAEVVPLAGLEGWHRDPETGNVRHDGGRFFSVIGLRCRERVGRDETGWDQPIIEQPEVGILGVLARPIGGVLHFCLQAKEEPGNLGGAQLSPTVQATFSNYTGAHGGGPPTFLRHFTDPAPRRVLFSRLQAEDGGRFLHKSNRNLIVEADPDLPEELPAGFIWLTLRQIAWLLREDDVVNACARSVLASLVMPPAEGAPPLPAGDPSPWTPEEVRPETIWETLQWLDDRRAAIHVQAHRIGLRDLRDWWTDEEGFFSRRDGRSFRVVGLRIAATGREVSSWCQPIIERTPTGLIGLLVRRGPAGLELLMQARAEPGDRATVLLGPTVQATRPDPRPHPRHEPLLDAFREPGGLHVVHESRQAEEGARFFREHHLHRILELPAGAEVPLGEDHRWIPLAHVRYLIHLGGQVNSFARSVVACLL